MIAWSLQEEPMDKEHRGLQLLVHKDLGTVPSGSTGHVYPVMKLVLAWSLCSRNSDNSVYFIPLMILFIEISLKSNLWLTKNMSSWNLGIIKTNCQDPKDKAESVREEDACVCCYFLPY